MREKLIEMLNEAFEKQYKKRGLLTANHTADHLLENGVIVPPCKVWDTVYIISDYTNEILDRLIIEIIIKKDGYGFIFDTQSSWSDTDIGKTVFLTREEAEAELNKRGATNAKNN